MIKDNNEVSVDINWDGFKFEFIVKKSESITMYMMHQCGFQILNSKMEGRDIPTDKVPEEVIDLLCDHLMEDL